MTSLARNPSKATTASNGKTTSSSPLCCITYSHNTWVKLLQAPSDYAAAEAKLLCQLTNTTWAVWVPDHGGMVLDRSTFYC